MMARRVVIAIGAALAGACGFTGEGTAPPTGADGGPDGSVPVAADGRACAPKEDCATDGDEDCNGLADCEDPACVSAGYHCVAAPSGDAWEGPLSVQTGDAASASCPPGFPALVLSGGDSPTAGGCTCTCGPATGATCASVLHSGNSGCTNHASVTVTTTCIALPPDSDEFKRDAIVASGGSCPSTKTLNPPKWATAVRACAASAGHGCAGGGLCAPPSASVITERSCVLHRGDTPAACPMGFPARATYFSGILDTRDCTCGCTATGSCGAATVDLYADPACNVVMATNIGSAACQATGVLNGARLNNVGSASCTAVAGAASGSVTGKGPVTLCCAP